MKIKRIFILVSFMVLLLISGCTDTESVIMNQKFKEQSQKSEKFKNKLFTEGLAKKLDYNVRLGNGEVIIKEIIFDTNFLTLTYEVPKKLSSLNIKISGDSKEIKNTNSFTGFSSSNKSPSFYTNPSLNTISIPHNLKLINQKINLQIEINNSYENLSIDFPGDKIASLTKEVWFNKRGEEVKDTNSAIARVKLGINYLEIESKGFSKDLVVLDLREKRLLQRNLGSYSSDDSLETFEALPIYRTNINIKLLYSDKVVLINY